MLKNSSLVRKSRKHNLIAYTNHSKFLKTTPNFEKVTPETAPETATDPNSHSRSEKFEKSIPILTPDPVKFGGGGGSGHT